MNTVVIVESPAKAKTINKYLGDTYKVLPTVGHVRHLPSKNGSVRPEDDFSMDWEIMPSSEKNIKEISKALKGASRLFLATDPDREGEAISWHVHDLLKEKTDLNNIEVKRVIFNEITQDAILKAFQHPRELDDELVEAYFARRALDYLVGFNLSPVLWRKLPGSKSAGRVQSVALRLICERETEIENFKSQEYWSINSIFLTKKNEIISANLSHLNGEKIKKFDLENENAANKAVKLIEDRKFYVSDIIQKKTRNHPRPPFTTSTLQQEASKKLRFSATRTMSLAQRLYEGVNVDGEALGLITYMRTDGVQIAGEAINQVRKLIEKDFGSNYVPNSPRIYKSKAKNAQEAHEAIRPTDVSLHPNKLIPYLDADQQKLYKLIWERTVASQMESATLDQVTVTIGCADNMVCLKATGSIVTFDGFLKIYKESDDDQTETPDVSTQKEVILPTLEKKQQLTIKEVIPEKHFTQPKPRFTEASLVKTLEEHGIGRPSTYANIISVLQDRHYVRLEQRRFTPEARGRVVTAFLESFFPKYVAYDFTADLENKLDDISGGRIDWKKVLREFWNTFDEAVNETKDLRIKEVLDKLDALLGPHFFRVGKDGIDPRKCSSCKDGRLNLKIGKLGAFIGCSNYPECSFTRPLEVISGGTSGDYAVNGPKFLGNDYKTEKPVSLRKGPYGFYVQLGEEEALKEFLPKSSSNLKKPKKAKVTKIKPKRSSVPKTMSPAAINLDVALGLLSLPREIGIDPNTGDMISAGIGRFGPYLKRGGTYVSIKGDHDVLTIGHNTAIDLMANAPKKDPPKQIGIHPKNKNPINLKKGRWGFYLQNGRTMANLPKGADEKLITLEEAVNLIDQKSGKKNKKQKKS